MYRPSEDKLEHLNWGQGGRGGGEWHAEDDMKMITSSGLSNKTHLPHATRFTQLAKIVQAARVSPLRSSTSGSWLTNALPQA